MPPQNTLPNQLSNQPASNSSKLNVPEVPPAGANLETSDVNQSVWRYIKSQKLRQLLVLIPLLVIWEVFIIILAVKSIALSHGGGRFFGAMIMLPLIVFGAWFYRLRQQFEAAFLEHFAQANGYSFSKNGDVDETYGTIFRLNGSHGVSDIITGSYHGNSLRLFLHSLTVGYGRNRRTYQNTVMELDLHGQLPNLLMVSRHAGYGPNLVGAFGTKNAISLEGNFNRNFELYAPKGNELEALEIFSPDTMALMEDESKGYRVEFSANRIYIYANGYVSKSADLKQIFTLAKQLIDKIGPLAARLKNDSAIVLTPANNIKSRKLYNNFDTVISALSIGFVIFMFGFTIYSLSKVGPQSRAQLPEAIKVSGSYLQDLAQNDSAAAFRLEAPHYQQKRNEQAQLIDPAVYVPSGEQVIIDKTAGQISSQFLAAVVYKFSDPKGPLYVEVWLEKNKGTWQVYGFNSSHTPIKARIIL